METSCCKGCSTCARKRETTARGSFHSRGCEWQVKTLDGKNHTYCVQASTTVAELKDMVAKDTGIPANLQRLIFRGKVYS
jgi:hypothetical protein